MLDHSGKKYENAFEMHFTPDLPNKEDKHTVYIETLSSVNFKHILFLITKRH